LTSGTLRSRATGSNGRLPPVVGSFSTGPRTCSTVRMTAQAAGVSIGVRVALLAPTNLRRATRGWASSTSRPGSSAVTKNPCSRTCSVSRRAVVRHETMAGLRWRQVAAERFRTGILSSFVIFG
jgi:hypothetical protein